MTLAKFKRHNQDAWLVVHPDDFSSAYTDSETGIHYVRVRAGYSHAVDATPLEAADLVEKAMCGSN